MEIIRTVVVAAFALLAVASARLWFQQRSRPAAWLASTFVVLAVGIGFSRLGAALGGDVGMVLGRVARVSIVAFPYLLFRFAASLAPPRRAVHAVAAAVIVPVLVASALVSAPPEGPTPGWYLAYVLAALTSWTLLSAWVVRTLWKAGRNQPSVARKRMRTLATAAAVINVALVTAGLSATMGDSEAFVGAVQGVALGSAVLFYLGFDPPVFVRSAWRRAEERSLWQAEGELIASTTRDEVVESMLPHISHLLGGGPAAFLDRTGHVHRYGRPSSALLGCLRDDATRYTEPTLVADSVLLDLNGGRLGVVTSSFTPLFGSDELEYTGWLGVLVDLALERVEYHDREREARQQAEQLAQELEALVYGLTHDLRNPIVAVLGYLDCLEEDYAGSFDSSGRHFLSRLRTNAQYMDRLIADLLSLSRLGRVPDDRQPVDLMVIAEQVADESWEGHPRAMIKVTERVPEVLMSPARARQLLTNLVSNALLHSGRPDVTVTIRPAPPTQDGHACISVADDGCGIPAAHRTKVFGMFERLEHGAKEDGNGTGIGLAMCQRIVAQAGGRIWVADSDVGTDMRVQLPTAAPPAHGGTETDS